MDNADNIYESREGGEDLFFFSSFNGKALREAYVFFVADFFFFIRRYILMPQRDYVDN